MKHEQINVASTQSAKAGALFVPEAAGVAELFSCDAHGDQSEHDHREEIDDGHPGEATLQNDRDIVATAVQK